MYKHIDATHPDYNNLLFYYTFDENQDVNTTVHPTILQMPLTEQYSVSLKVKSTAALKCSRIFMKRMNVPRLYSARAFIISILIQCLSLIQLRPHRFQLSFSAIH